jgi:cytochrome P450
MDWALAEVLSDERVLRKMRCELDAVVGTARMVGTDDLASLPYVKAAVKEALRKHPPGPLLVPHEAVEACDLEVESDDPKHPVYRIPKGTMVLINAWAIAHDPAVWKDPHKFLPERFLADVAGQETADFDDDRENRSQKPELSSGGDHVFGQRFDLVPFGGGRRICPGIALSLGILELTLASLVHCFEWALPPGGVDMSEKYGMAVPRRAPLLAAPVSFRLANSVWSDQSPVSI